MSISLACVLAGAPLVAAADGVPDVVNDIRAEATRPLNGPAGRPLPLAANWQLGVGDHEAQGFNTDYQKKMIEQGHHLIPTLDMPDPTDNYHYQNYDKWKSVVQTFAKWDIPITLEGSNWHRNLTIDSRWTDLPKDQNPLLLRRDKNGNTYIDDHKVSPFGPEKPWHEVGQHLIQDAPGFAKIQQWYPDPSKVILLSNNETRRLGSQDAEKSVRYVDAHGTGTSNNQQRAAVGDGYATRFGDMIESMRNSLSPDWKQAATIIGYSGDVGTEAFAPTSYGRFGNWPKYSTATFGDADHPAKIDRSHLPWDGASVSYYPSSGSRDYRVWSPQVQWNNVPFELEQVLQDNPGFWLEQSVWDGGQDQLQSYRDDGQTYGPARYAGYAQYGMWISRPRVVRQFRLHAKKRSQFPGEYQALLESVDRVYDNAVLKRFWRKSTLVVNPDSTSPYYHNLIPEFSDANVARWFLLDTDANTGYDHGDVFSTLNVYSLARVRGDQGSREWLLYAYAPRGEEDGVDITVPGFGHVTVDATVGGAFYRIDEQTGQVTRVANTVPEPASVGLLGLGGVMLLRRQRGSKA